MRYQRFDGSPTGPTMRAERARQTYDGIKAAALKLFASRGYDATSLQDIADEMGLTKAAVQYHFHSKVRILEAVINPAYSDILALVDRLGLIADRHERIDEMVNSTVDILVGQRAVMSLLAGDPVMHSQIQAVRPMDEILGRVVDVLYGPDPTLEQRLAVFAVSGLARASWGLNEVGGERLRPALRVTVRRLLELPAVDSLGRSVVISGAP